MHEDCRGLGSKLIHGLAISLLSQKPKIIVIVKPFPYCFLLNHNHTLKMHHYPIYVHKCWHKTCERHFYPPNRNIYSFLKRMQTSKMVSFWNQSGFGSLGSLSHLIPEAQERIGSEGSQKKVKTGSNKKYGEWGGRRDIDIYTEINLLTHLPRYLF